MFRHIVSLPVVALFLLILAPGAHGEVVRFPSLDGATELSAFLQQPAGEGPFPAVVFLHGCSGLQRNGRPFSIYRAWASELNQAGYVVLMVDSAGPRGFGATCGPVPERKVMYRNRPKDAYGALAYLQSLPRVQPDRIGLIGWSQGGGIVLLTIVSPSIGRPSPPPKNDFKAAVAFYPAACNDRLQSQPFTEVPPKSWSTSIPLLVLQGGADNWTKAAPCRAFIEQTKARGEPVSITVYPDAHHSFDAPNMPVQPRIKYRTRDGHPPMTGTNPAARAKALRAVPAFLSRFQIAN